MQIQNNDPQDSVLIKNHPIIKKIIDPNEQTEVSKIPTKEDFGVNIIFAVWNILSKKYAHISTKLSHSRNESSRE